MAESYLVQTPENVAVSYDLAGIGSRFLAAATDSIIQIVLIILVAFAMAVAGGIGASSSTLRELTGSGTDRFGVWLIALFLVAIFLLLWGYYAAFEMAWNGQTPGKRLTRLRVLRENGYPIGPIDALIRNLVRLVDFLPMAYGLGVVVMLVDKRSRRLGDLAAGTIVVKERRALRAADLLAPEPPLEPGPEEPHLEVPNADRLTAADYSLLREYLLRREQLAPAPRAALARELAEAMASRLDAPVPEDGLAADEFVQDVAAAYRVRHRASG